jgi:hypothetical protein
MRWRLACINDLAIKESNRKYPTPGSMIVLKEFEVCRGHTELAMGILGCGEHTVRVETGLVPLRERRRGVIEVGEGGVIDVPSLSRQFRILADAVNIDRPLRTVNGFSSKVQRIGMRSAPAQPKLRHLGPTFATPLLTPTRRRQTSLLTRPPFIYPVGTGSRAIRPSIAPNRRRVRCPCAALICAVLLVMNLLVPFSSFWLRGCLGRTLA